MLCGMLVRELGQAVLAVSDTFSPDTALLFPTERAEDAAPGACFICVRGASQDGHLHLSGAAARGTVCAVIDRPEFSPVCRALGLPYVLVSDTRAVLLPLYLAFSGHPESSMRFLAVTGTNGKTSVTYLLEAIFSPMERCAVIGTVENRIAGIPRPTDMTTPAPRTLAAFLTEAAAAGVTRVLCEASSHALAQKRLSGLGIDCGIFTNLTEDHLDYHKTADQYFAAKRSLFLQCGTGVINADDKYGAVLLSDPAFRGRLHGFSAAGNTDADAEFRALDILSSEEGSRFRFCTEDREASVFLPLRGSFMVSNAAAALSCACLSGVPLGDAAAAVGSLRRIPGRMERIVRTPFSVYLDYAHTPDALMRALSALRTKGSGRLLLLFGCGGDREHEKRPQMGAIAARYADFFIVTDDNPRNEDPAAIRAEICSGIPASADFRTVPGREAAIAAILSEAHPGDTVLLAGKGHETYIADSTGKHPFSETEIVQSVLSARGYGYSK